MEYNKEIELLGGDDLIVMGGDLENPTPQKLTEEQMKAAITGLQSRLQKYEEKLQAHKLVGLYVQDLIDMWPKVTLRTLWTVTKKVADLKEALELTR